MKTLVLLLALSVSAAALRGEENRDPAVHPVDQAAEEYQKTVKEMTRRLEKNFDVDFPESCTFVQVLNYLSSACNVPQKMDPKLLDSDALKTRMIFKVQKQTAAQILDEACRQAGLKWSLNPTLYITVLESKKE